MLRLHPQTILGIGNHVQQQAHGYESGFSEERHDEINGDG